MSFTVVPLQGLGLPTGSTIPFGTKFVLQDVPEWLKQDENYLKDLSRQERRDTLDAKQALISEYYANSFGYPDPDWTGQRPKGIQDLRLQSAILANLSIWLIQPTPIRFTIAFHALTHLEGREIDPPLIMQSPREPPLWCHRRDGSNPILPRHLIKAARLFERLTLVPRKNDVWAALRAFWAALASFQPDYRYPLFWQGIESLFGSDKTWKVSPRIRDRLSYFLADTPAMREKICDMVEACYQTRSEIVHGRWNEGPELEDRIYETEGIVRTVVRHIADKPGMLGAFLSPKRDDFLDAWVRSKSLTPPPLP